MATEVTRSLYINYDNAPTYFTANGVSLQINIAGTEVAIRHYMNGSKTGYATINSAGMDVLFPSDTAIPNKLDVASYIKQLFSSSSNWVEFRIDGTALERFPGSTGEFTRTYTNETVSAFRKNSTFMSYHNAPNTVNGTSVRYLNLTLYFTKYNCSANAVGNGIASASVDKSECYNGDTVTFTPKLVNGATWDGWYSDAECTNLVSTSQNYSVSPSSDITLYAKATIDAVVYSCSAVAGENIASASVSDESVVSGESTIFTATLSEHCTFDGWFSDSGCTSLVSIENPYTAVITSDTTLYAKGTKISYSISVGTAEHGTATVSANTAHYGDSVTFTFTPEDETWELYGWYSDEGLTQLVSEDNPYAHSVTENVTLYPKVGKKRYTITLRSTANTLAHSATKLSIISADPMLLTEEDYRNLRSGSFDSISNEKVIDYATKTGLYTSSYSVSIIAYKESVVALYADAKPTTGILLDTKTTYFLKDNIQISNGPYYITTISGDSVYETYKASSLPARSECQAVSLEGIEYSEAYPKIVGQGLETVFEAILLDGYSFAGWYSDADCTTLVSEKNPAQIIAPAYTGEEETVTTLTLYAKATKITTGTGCFLKRNGAWAEAQAVYKKVNGAWVLQTDGTYKTEIQNGNYKLSK